MGGSAFIDEVEYDECDNFWLCSFKVEGVVFNCSEQYFQYKKSFDPEDQKKVLESKSAIKSWEEGSQVKLRPDWEKVKVQIMYDGNFAKFNQNTDLAEKLVSSKGSVNFYYSTNFWNYWNGLILERVRAELRGTDEDKIRRQQIIKLMTEYEQGKLDNKK
jgi:ribA/ribD-fused uncharacterized protein